MKIDEKIKELRRIVTSGMRKGDRAFIIEESKKAGLNFNPNTNCANCYKDQAIILYNHIRKTQKTKETNCDYYMRNGVRCIWNGFIVSNETLTNAYALQLLANGFPSSLLLKK